jgi:hypothetical protein
MYTLIVIQNQHPLDRVHHRFTYNQLSRACSCTLNVHGHVSHLRTTIETATSIPFQLH